MKKELVAWLKEQPKQFSDAVFESPDLLGDGQLSVDKLRELDDKFNPEDKND